MIHRCTRVTANWSQMGGKCVAISKILERNFMLERRGYFCFLLILTIFLNQTSALAVDCPPGSTLAFEGYAEAPGAGEHRIKSTAWDKAKSYASWQLGIVLFEWKNLCFNRPGAQSWVTDADITYYLDNMDSACYEKQLAPYPAHYWRCVTTAGKNTKCCDWPDSSACDPEDFNCEVNQSSNPPL